MAPSAINPDDGGMPNVNGTSTATAMVAVRPGRAPMTVPAITPPIASRMLTGVSAASRYSMPGMGLLLGDAHFAGDRLVFLLALRHELRHLVQPDVDHREALLLHALDEGGILVDLGDEVGDFLLARLGRRVGHREAAVGAAHQVEALLLEGR